MFRFLPEQASDFAQNVDFVNNLITDISVFFTVAIVGAMIYFAIRYRRKDGVDHETPQIRGSHFLEIVWTVVPTIICIFVAYYGVVYYRDLRQVPADAMVINVKGQKWKWDFQYENGKKTTGEFVVPVSKPVKLLMSSRDVLHSFFIPSMRVKRDVVPGQFNYLWFRPIKTGEYHSFCTEYCGLEHSKMLATLRVVSQAEFDKWLADRSAEMELAGMTPVKRGAAAYVQKACNSCHSLDGSRLVGPSFLKLLGREVKFSDGSSLIADENYIKESILNPGAKVVESYPDKVMPAFAGQLAEEEVDGLIAFIRTVDGSQPIVVPKPAAASKADDAATANLSPVEKGKKLYQDKLCITCHSLDGSKLVGPSLKGVYGTPQKLTDGTSPVADDAYIKESILNPMAKIVEGYPPAMPPYQGQLSDEDIANIIEFLKTVK